MRFRGEILREKNAVQRLKRMEERDQERCSKIETNGRERERRRTLF